MFDMFKPAMRIAAFAVALVVGAGTAAADTIVVGGKDFTEQFLVAEMTRQLLEAKGFEVEKNDGLGSTVLRQAQENEQIDIYWEYTGTALVVYNKVEERLSPQETYQRVKELDAEKGLVWLAPSEANNTYALAIRPDNPKTDGMKTISDMAAGYRAGESILMGATAEFPRRDDGLIGLEKAYDFEAGRANIRPMEIGLVYPALADGNVDVATVGATDGRIAAMDLIVLKDDKSFFPNYALVPVIRAETLEANPELGEILNSLSGKFDDATMQRLNGEVDVHQKTIDDVARSFLKEQGLI